MTTQLQAVIPNIGDVSDVEVIEILVKVGDHVNVDTPLLTLETDKASMDVPSSHEGIVTDIKVNIGDKVSEGSLILFLDPAAKFSANSNSIEQSNDKKNNMTQELSVKETGAVKSTEVQRVNITIPDIGDTANIDVIDVLVQVGDSITIDQAVITLEGDKATMDIPSTLAGIVEQVSVKVGDKKSPKKTPKKKTIKELMYTPQIFLL